MPPIVSVVIPTYKRPEMLRRAVASVRAQTLEDWELIVSDDEQDPGASWAWLEQMAEADARIRIARNPGPRGQVGNVNHALQLACGRWVKPLFDDDAMKPSCLERLVGAAGGREGIAVVSCLADRYVDGALRRVARRSERATLERIDQRRVHLAMYIQDVEIGIPSQVLVPRRLIDDGVLWERLADVYSGEDTWWYARLLMHGDLLLLNEPLVDQHWGHRSITAHMRERPERLDRELAKMRERYLPLIDPSLKPPPLRVVLQQLRVIRGLVRLRDDEPLRALGMMASVLHPRAWAMSFRWLARRSFPGRFCAIKREAIWP